MMFVWVGLVGGYSGGLLISEEVISCGFGIVAAVGDEAGVGVGWGGAERSRVSRILDASTFVKHFVEIVLNEILASDIERRASSLQVSNIVFDKEVVLVGSSGMIKIGKIENKKIGEIKLEKEKNKLCCGKGSGSGGGKGDWKSNATFLQLFSSGCSKI